jgi:choline dehydrogenase-like flavoprotein
MIMKTMAILTDRKTLPEYDAIIVGSGAGGGMMAMQLALGGMKVLMIEAGRNYEPTIETPMFNTPEQAPLRGQSTPEKPFGYYDATVDGGWQVPGEPYSDKAGTQHPFKWWRARMLGGRTNHWGRISLRFGPHDFKPKTRDGIGYDWPISSLLRQDPAHHRDLRDERRHGKHPGHTARHPPAAAEATRRRNAREKTRG